MIFNEYKIADICNRIKYGTMQKKDKITENGKYNIWSGYRIVGKYDEYNICEDQVIVVARGVGGTGDVKYSTEKCYLTNLSIALDINKSIVNPKYLYYYFQIKNLRYLDSGSAQSQITINDLKNVVVSIPTLELQNKIVYALSSIDGKIEINEKINNNLYELAYKYLKELQSTDEVPISEFGKIQGGYAFKGKDLLDSKTNNRIIKIKNLRNEINANVTNSQFVDDAVVDKLDLKFKIEKGNVAIAMTGAELGKTGFVYGYDNYYLNQRVGLIKGKTKEKELYLNILALSLEFQDLLNSKGYGSAQPNVSTTDIENVVIQDIEELNLTKFYDLVNPIYRKIILNCEENLNLEQLRDTLLPKLMNGEIDLDNIEI